MESQVFFTHLNEIHFDVTFERITSAQGGIEEVSSLLCHWSEHNHSLPLVTDAENDPELLSWLNPPPPPPALHTSLIPVLSCCQSVRWVCFPILLLLYHSVCFPRYITQMGFLVVSKPGQIAFCGPCSPSL